MDSQDRKQSSPPGRFVGETVDAAKDQPIADNIDSAGEAIRRERTQRHFELAAPVRDPLASEMDKASIFSALFGGASTTFKIDRFTLLARIGGGAMGEVYAAYDERLERKVAIKLIHRYGDSGGREWQRGDGAVGVSSHASHDAAVHASDDRMLREAKIMAQVTDHNVVRVYDAGVCGGRVYIAMEYIRGGTLRGWLESLWSDVEISLRARQERIVHQFIAAGRGLHAAHHAGLVHRDFKPDNVLVGEDGQPRVGDFGLARPVTQGGIVTADATATSIDMLDLTTGDTWPMSATEGKEWSLRLKWFSTQAGQVAGTPRYMAPEQWRGEVPDHRSDQFSFCVALWEALVREPPFAGTTPRALMDATTSGEHVQAPLVAKIPAPVRKALERGLSVEPQDRFSDMGALLAALEDWPRRRQRRVRALVGGATVVIFGALLYAALSPLDSASPCAKAGAAIDSIWTAERRHSLALDPAMNRVVQELDDYASAWKRACVDACEATYVDRTQSVELLDRRMICINRRLVRLQALVEELDTTAEGEGAGEANPTLLSGNAAIAAVELPAISACNDGELLRYGLKPPPSAVADEVAAMRRVLAEARTLELLGRWDEALTVAQAQVDIVVSGDVDYEPVRAEALFQLGRLLCYRGTSADVARGEHMIVQSVNMANSERHDELAAEALAFLLSSAYLNYGSTTLHRIGDSQNGHALAARAFAANRRIGDRKRDRAELLRRAGLLWGLDKDYERAESMQRQGLAVLSQDLDVPWLYKAAHLNDLANTVRDQGRGEEARILYAEARALYAQLGDEHLHVARVDFNRAVLFLRQGHADDARELLQKVLAIRQRSLGPMHPEVGAVYWALADANQHTGALQAAEEAADAGLQIYEQVLDADNPRLADGYQIMGVIHYRRGNYHSARASYQLAIDRLIARLGPQHQEVGYAQANLAEAELMLGLHAKALNSIDVAERVIGDVSTSDRLMAAFIHSVRGRALLGLGRARGAAAALTQSLQHFAQYADEGAPLERAVVHWTLARALANIDGRKSPRARAQAEAALARFESAGATGQANAKVVRSWLTHRRR